MRAGGKNGSAKRSSISVLIAAAPLVPRRYAGPVAPANTPRSHARYPSAEIAAAALPANDYSLALHKSFRFPQSHGETSSPAADSFRCASAAGLGASISTRDSAQRLFAEWQAIVRMSPPDRKSETIYLDVVITLIDERYAPVQTQL